MIFTVFLINLFPDMLAISSDVWACVCVLTERQKQNEKKHASSSSSNKEAGVSTGSNAQLEPRLTGSKMIHRGEGDV